MTTHELALKIVEELRHTTYGAGYSREELAQRIGVNLRQLRRARVLAEKLADFPIGYKDGYCRLWTDEAVAAEVEHRNKCHRPYMHLVEKARPKQTKIKPIAEQERMQI